jgi:hypothetical protein
MHLVDVPQHVIEHGDDRQSIFCDEIHLKDNQIWHAIQSASAYSYDEQVSNWV